MQHPFRLVLGTRNKKKKAELLRLIGRQPIELLSLSESANIREVEESGETFSDNAELKATGYAKQTGNWVLAEDSGLSVAALDGAPGVYSARFSGESATDESNNQLLLEKLCNENDDRSAWYTCHIALADPEGKIVAGSEANCHGRILDSPQGDAGFGYDPLFEIPEYDLTFAQLGDSVKSVLSHRARAYRLILPQLLAIIQSEVRLNKASR